MAGWSADPGENGPPSCIWTGDRRHVKRIESDFRCVAELIDPDTLTQVGEYTPGEK